MNFLKFYLSLGIVGIITYFGVINYSTKEKKPIQFITGKQYESEWKKVDSLESNGLPKSALEIVNIIYESAIKDSNHQQYIKSLLYIMKYKNSREEDAYENLIKDLKIEISKAKFPNNAILNSIIAEMYWNYYINNRWKFYNRTNTVNFNKDDLKTWTLDDIANEVIRHYNISVENADSLQRVFVKDFNVIIERGTKPNNLRPTLFDFLAFRAIDFFSNPELTLTRPADKFELKEKIFFENSENFVNSEVKTNDTLSQHYNSVLLFKKLLKFRLEDSNKDALIDADLHRLEFVYKNSVNEIKDSLYLESLKSLEKKYETESFSSLVSYKIAEYYNSKSTYYNPIIKETEKFKNYASNAWNICNKVTSGKVKNEGTERCDILKKQIELPDLKFEIENYIIPDENFATKISWKNINKIHYRIASIDKDKLLKIKEKYYNNEELFSTLFSESKTFYENSLELPATGDYNTHSIELILNPLPSGTYIVFMSDNKTFEYVKGSVAFDFLNSTSLSYSYRSRNGGYDFFVNNRKTGHPMQAVTAEIWVNKYNYTFRKYSWVSHGKYTTNTEGYFEVLKSKDLENYSFYVELRSGKDYLISDNSYYSYYYQNNPKPQITTHLFTDRAIYRPGQTIYFKGIVIESNGDDRKILPDYKQNVTLYDVNYQKVADIQLTTNEYGSFNGSFAIPTNLLNGQMQIHTTRGSKYISVEEYKRPKFEVKVLPLDGDYLLNQDVEIKGSAISYSGAGLSDATVSYRIVRKPMYRGWWYSMYNTSNTEIISGKAITDNKGEFKINFNAIPDLSYPKNENTSFNYEIAIDVTDINGETQSTSKNITVGYVALSVNFGIPENLSNDYSEKIDISSYNLNGEFVAADGNVKIFKLKTPEILLKNKLWTHSDKKFYTKEEWYNKLPENEFDNELDFENYEKEKLVKTLDFNTKVSKKCDLSKDIKGFVPGYYFAEISSTDKFGNKVSSKSYFTVFSKEKLVMPYKTYNFHHTENKSYEPGESAFIFIGSSAKNVKALMEIEHKGKIILKDNVDLSDNINKIEIPIKEIYRGNVSVHFTYTINNRFFTHSDQIYVPYTNKQLDIEFETFRNKLYPGENEEWKLKLKGKNGDKVAAEMLTTLYDASLDAFKKNYWSFDIWNSYYTSLYRYSDVFNTSSSTFLGQNSYNLYYNNLYYDYLNWFGFDYYSGYYGGYYRYSSKTRGLEKSAAPVMADGLVDDISGNVMAEEQEASSGEKMKNGRGDADKKADTFSTTVALTKDEAKNLEGKDSRDREENAQEEVKIRTNFSETAFFYPSLNTNEKGEVIVKFTIPESLTKWKMMGMAHTKDLKTGFVFNELVTQKDLMVMPNVPRFFRENDLIEFPVKISNISESKLSGNAKLEFFDAISMKPISEIFINQNEIAGKSFDVDASSNSLISWKLKIPEGYSAITYRITAKTNKFSDGEENVIPVMTNRMLVTETLPLPIRGKQTKVYSLDKLLQSGNSKTMRNFKLTLEFSSNPAWYAVQSLPYLMEYPYECAEQVFSRYYANSIASHIANSSPKIKKVFDTWKNTPNSEALLSNLEKNQELKSLLLQETPWVLNAQNETERKKRVALLFDLNKMSNELESAMKKLQKMQVSNGGWPWFEGMPESRYITQHVVNGMGKLDKLGIKNIRNDKRIWNMIINAVSYLDDRIDEDYDWLKKYYSAEEMKQDKIGDIQIHYLYARSFFKDIPIKNKNQEAIDYYKGQAEKYWLNKSKYLQGLIALSTHRNGNKDLPLKIAKSLKEFSLDSDEMGMYWKDNYAGYYWYQAPIEFQALMIELFDEVVNDEKSVNDLKVWLLKQKQTTDWKTTKATVEAVYALLMRGTEWLENDELVEITLGNLKIDPKNDDAVKVEAGTGYFKKSWSASEIKPEMGKVTLKKETEGVSWGGLYWQYFEQLDKITPHETPLKLNKKLFIEKNSPKGKILDPISEKNILKVGDKVVVRIELRVDRNMEYVHMKDMRASCFEPVNVISRYKYQDGLGYYESTKDASTNFFFSYLPKGTYVFEYTLLVGHKGNFSNGITTIQCMYAPEFTSHSEGVRVMVE